MDYIPPDLSLSIVLLSQSEPPKLPLDVVLCAPPIEDDTQYIFGNSFTSGIVSQDLVLTRTKTPNELGLVVLERRDVYPGFIHGVVLREKDEVDVEIGLLPYGFNAQKFGTTFLESSIRGVIVKGIKSNITFGTPALINYLTPAYPEGFVTTLFGLSSIVNNNKTLQPNTWESSSVGMPLVYNLKQFVRAYGYDHSLYGQAYLIGGVKYLTLYGISSNAFGPAVVTNTTANQTAAPQGINSAIVPAPTVSPRILYAVGVNSLAMGKPGARDPALKPLGGMHTTYGTPTIWYHTRPLLLDGIPSYQSGFPRVADPTQFVQPPSLLTSAIFGDTAIRNLSFKVSVPAIYDDSFSDYATLTNSNRYYAPKGIDSLSIGSLSIKNGTPELFPNTVNTGYIAGMPAISYRIREVKPTGFDRLLPGNATLTKTPELNPRSHQSSVFGEQTVWYKNRKLEALGFQKEDISKPTIWFRYRNTNPKSWQSSTVSEPALTRGLREVISNGFVDDRYGNAWISQGVRVLEPKAIYQDFASNHFVGTHQEIKPNGYVATLFGERIIPLSKSIYPQGFATLWGLQEVSLFTRNIAPQGYISVGQQGADRWGQALTYNKTQYINNYYQGDSGLVPPSWPDYMLIENRNKTVGVTGFSSQRFGYSQIDNNAAPLSPMGIDPPTSTRFNRSLIAHAIRYLPLQGIEPPLITDWAVIYNGARPILPASKTYSQYGQPLVANTRRYYNNVGRIDSLEVGMPAIGYAIRAIDIESRYSISPPQINLPIIDLLKKYVTFQGYETAKYGLASLSVHFNIISPSWDQREKFGYPILKNLTPNLLINGADSSEFGQSLIRTRFREVVAQGDNTNVFGLHKISDTKQYIDIRGFQDSTASQQHTVTKTGTNPYVLQNIYLNNESDDSKDGFGIWFDPNVYGQQVPIAGINQNVVIPSSINPRNSFGTAFLYSNNIQINGGIGIDGVSKGLSVLNKKQSVSIAGQGISARIVCGKPRMSPHTIWSVKEAPDQAVSNHHGIRGEWVGAGTGSPHSSRIGRPFIESTIRRLSPYGHEDSNIGRHSLELQLRTIKPEPFNLLRMGLPSIPFTPQDIVINKGIDSQLLGSASVERPLYIGPQTLRPSGIDSFDVGANEVENLIRYINSIGEESLLMGRSLSGDTPFMWQGLRIGEAVPIIVGAGDNSVFGGAVISLRVRDITLKGFNAFNSGYELSSFYERMTVKNKNSNLPASRSIEVLGINPTSVSGVPDIKLAQQYIRPDGNSEQFRKGGYHA